MRWPWKKKSSGFPDDADGNALQSIADQGNDMGKPMEVDFHVAVASEDEGIAIARVAAEHGFRGDLQPDEDDSSPESSWTLTCTRTMVLTYEAVIETQAKLQLLCDPHGGSVDGWGTFGNSEENAQATWDDYYARIKERRICLLYTSPSPRDQ